MTSLTTRGTSLTTKGTSAPLATDAVEVEVGEGRAKGAAMRTVVLACGVLLLGATFLLSLAIGSERIPFEAVLHALWQPDGSTEQLIITSRRVPRTVLGVLVGVALAVSGALIQAMTRNPLADPGILGVNAGAAFSVAMAVTVFGISNLWGYVWFAFLGAVVVTVVVYVLGSAGRGGATPVRLTLVGVAVGAVLAGITTGLMLIDPHAFVQMRAWNAGSIAVEANANSLVMVPFMVIGLLLAAVIAGQLNALSLGDDLARSLGANIARTRITGVIAVTLPCGAATAAAGPIGFVGLMIPHIARWIVGPDQRWILAYSVIGGPILVLLSDIVGRLIVYPTEMQVGVVTAFVGAPVLILMVRRKKASGL